jgi:hypothetical protein
MKCGLLALFAISAAIAIPAAAQQITDTQREPATLDNKRPLIQRKEKVPTSRIVSGKVVDEVNGTPLKGAIVTLTDLSSHGRREMITKDDGRYNFDDLSFSIDYELIARYKNSVTDVRKLSQYDHTVKAVRILTISDNSPSSSSVNEAKKDKHPEVKK